jgi:hypothetical protein
MSKHNIIFVSNYTAPRDIELIFKKDFKICGSKKLMSNNNNRIEKLYLL